MLRGTAGSQPNMRRRLMWPWPWYLLCIANSVLHGVDCLRLNFPKVHEIYRFANLTVVLISYIFIFNRSSITYFNNKQIKAGFLPSYLLVIFINTLLPQSTKDIYEYDCSE